MSRPTDLTPELADKLCQLVEEGLPMSRAAEHEGIDYSTLKRWQRRKGEPYEGFCASLKRAKAASQAASIRTIRMGAQGWQGEAWYLERSDPKNWGRRMEVKQEVKQPKEQRTEAQLLARAAELLKQAEQEGKEVH